MPHQELAKLFSLGDHKTHRLIDSMGRNIDRLHQVLGARRNLNLIRIPAQGQHMKLPRLPPAQQPQAFGFDFVFFEIDHADCSQVLLNPRVLDDPGQSVKPLGKIAKRTVRSFWT